jgi:hypothetical protein
MMQGVPILNSIANPVFDDTFVAVPEFGTFIQNLGMGAFNFSNSQVKLLLNPSTNDY